MEENSRVKEGWVGAQLIVNLAQIRTWILIVRHRKTSALLELIPEYCNIGHYRSY